MLFHVTGANGLVGKEVTKALAKLGDVHGTDVDDMDVTDLNQVQETLAARPPDAVVHLAGLKGNLPSQQRPLDFFRVNTVGTVNLLEVCRQLGVKKFVFFSSLVVHGPNDEAVDEASPLASAHPYSGSKGAAESMVHAYANAYAMQAVILRPSFIVGPIPPPQPYVDNMIYDFIQAIQDTGEIELMGHGQYQREWLHPRDIASAVTLALSSSQGGCETYHVVGERVTMYQLASLVIERVGSGKIRTNENRPGFSVISSSDKAWRKLGWRPETTLQTLIEEVWDEYRGRRGNGDHPHHRY